LSQVTCAYGPQWYSMSQTRTSSNQCAQYFIEDTE